MYASRSLFPLLLLAALSSAYAAGNSGSTNNAMVTTVPKVVLVPLGGQDPNLANGCWVRLFDGPNFKGKDELTIAGPMDLQSLKTPSGVNWQRKAESLTVGPKARVTVFENEMFKNKNLSFDANQKVADLSKEVGITHPIDSIKVACTG
jgi:hypothetical protein